MLRTTAGQLSGGTSRWERLALSSGVLYGALQVTAILFSAFVVIPTHAPIGSPPVETAAALARHSDLVLAGTYLFMLPLPFLLLFLSGLSETLRRVVDGGPVVAAAVLASGIAHAVIVSLGALLSGLSAPLALAGGDPAVVQQIDSITPLALSLAGFFQAVMAGVVSTALLESQLTRQWVPWTGFLLAVLSLLATVTLVANQLFPLVALSTLLFPLWVVVLGGSLLASERTEA